MAAAVREKYALCLLHLFVGITSEELYDLTRFGTPPVTRKRSIISSGRLRRPWQRTCMNPDAGGNAMLNEFQKRRISTTLQIMEKDLIEMERRLKRDDHSCVLYELKNDIPVSMREELLTKAAIVKEKIGRLAERFELDMMINQILEMHRMVDVIRQKE
jgi:hypothetical protein